MTNEFSYGVEEEEEEDEISLASLRPSPGKRPNEGQMGGGELKEGSGEAMLPPRSLSGREGERARAFFLRLLATGYLASHFSKSP